MTELINQGECSGCSSWHKLSDQDGGLGICDSIRSDHGQHLLGAAHPGCAAFVDGGEMEAEAEEASGSG